VDCHCVKSAAMVSKTVGFDAGKLVKGQRFLTVDTWFGAASLGHGCQCGGSAGGKQLLKGETNGRSGVSFASGLGGWRL